jgi:hypothetical protein
MTTLAGKMQRLNVYVTDFRTLGVTGGVFCYLTIDLAFILQGKPANFMRYCSLPEVPQ